MFSFHANYAVLMCVYKLKMPPLILERKSVIFDRRSLNTIGITPPLQNILCGEHNANDIKTEIADPLNYDVLKAFHIIKH